ncbi:hypothetical protein RLW55_00810 [Hyphomicrobium sp. B1]|uniref:hypothetical protein n=1 Tax=unclassified Hyphomicrobium TaxID=2619925 RepID=UPI000213E140|nr:MULTISPECIES: hypothetical protein [unclassified Hyphomicrobium]CCB63903.1 exported protein of unknown function [Hyphomicrobium sp. MC1]
MSMHKILSLAVVAGAFALYGVPANAESLPEIVNQQISDRGVPSYSGAENGSDASIVQQQLQQYGNSAQPDVDASASRGHDDSLVRLQYEQIPH